MKKKNKVIIFLLVLVMVYTMLQVVPYNKDKRDTPFRIAEGETPLVIAHGGAKKLNPENTVFAFENVYDMGVDVLELDLRMTKDGVLVTHHNATIDETSDHQGKVKDYTYEELCAMNFGYQFKDVNGKYPYRENVDASIREKLVPMRAEDMFARFGSDVSYIMEIKDGGKLGEKAAKQLNDFIVQYGLEKQVCVASFDEDVLEYFNEIKDEAIITSLDYETSTSFVVANLIGYGIFMNYDGYGMQLPMEEMNIPLGDKYLIWKVHKNDMFVHYWTIDDKKDMKKLIQNGADGIITDRPDLLIEVLDEMGYER